MVQISNPDRVIFPDIGATKRDVVDYYAAVADRMLAHLARRPLTLQRFPNGVAASGFMQKHAPDSFPASIGRVEVPKSNGVVIHPMVDDAEGLAFLANQGTVTFHIPNVRAAAIDRPDRLVIDLDPEAGDWTTARRAAIAARDLLVSLGAESGVMTTGSNGYHVVARLDASETSERIARAGRGIAELIAGSEPDRFTTAFRKRDRRGRVFIDWLRNRRAQTSVCPWSLRPGAHAPIAAPVRWEDLDGTDPDRYSIADLPRDDPLVDLPLVAAGTLCDGVERALESAGLEVDDIVDRFGRN